MIGGGGGPNHKSHAMTSSEIFKKETFCRAKITQNGRSEVVVCGHLTRILVKVEGKNEQLKSENVQLRRRVEKASVLKRITDGDVGAEPPATGGYGDLGAELPTAGRFL